MLDAPRPGTRAIASASSGSLVAELRAAARHNGGRSRPRPRRCRPSPPRADQRGDRAERMAGDVPERLEHGRPHAALGHHRVEMVEVPLLLRRPSAAIMRARGMAVAEHRQLAGIDAGGAIFAGLVDAQHRRDVRPRGRPGASRARRLRSCQRQVAGAFEAQPCDHQRSKRSKGSHSIRPSRCRGTTMHLVAADHRRVMIDRADRRPSRRRPEVHWVTPSNMPDSTPA